MFKVEYAFTLLILHFYIFKNAIGKFFHWFRNPVIHTCFSCDCSDFPRH